MHTSLIVFIYVTIVRQQVLDTSYGFKKEVNRMKKIVLFVDSQPRKIHIFLFLRFVSIFNNMKINNTQFYLIKSIKNI